MALISNDEVVKAIEKFAGALSTQQLGLVNHYPEKWAQPTRCFENALRKVKISGGRTQCGWIFDWRLTPHIPNVPGYLMATHHAVWCSPNGNLIDITPFRPETKHYPIRPNGSDILFQLDDTAQPVTIKNYLAPLPLLFYPLSQDPPLVAYVKELNKKEHYDCESLYKSLLDTG